MDEIPGPDTSMLTFTSRLATFNTEHQVAKRRASSQKKKQPSNVSWPHKSPSDEELARAGFFYKPVADSDDNVQCFHCAVKLDGWESEDVPLQEHLAHSSQCAWAVSLSVSDQAEDRDPMSAHLVEARRSTFADLWPHEKKKGWKCKTNKMVEAGWTYDPSPQDEDGTTCFYCNMSLDGWEPKDNPTEEHRRRMPDCPFFGLVERYKGTRKGGRGRASTASKASRLSTQSMQSTFSEAPSLMSLGDAAPDATIDESLQIDTTISSDAGKGRKKTTKGKKKNARQLSQDPPVEDPTDGLEPAPEPEAELEPSPVEEKPKTKRGRKVKAVQDSTIVDDSSMAEPVKKTKGRTKTKQPSPPRVSQDESQLQSELQDAIEAAAAVQSPPSKSGRGVKRTSDGLEKTSLTEDTTVDEIPAKPKRAAKGTRGKKGKKAAQEETELAIEEPTEQELKPKRSRSKKAQKLESEPEPEQEQKSEQIHEAVIEAEPDMEQEIEPEAIQAPDPEEEVEVEAEVETAQDLDYEQDIQEEPNQHVESEAEVEDQIRDDIEVEPELDPEQEPEVEAEEDGEQAKSPSVHGEVDMQDVEAGLEAEQSEEAAALAPTPAAAEFEPTPTPQSVRRSVVRRHTQEQASESLHSTPQSNHSSDAENHPPSSSNHAPTTVKRATTSIPPMDAENPALNPKEIFTSPSKTVRVPLAASTPNHSPSRRSPSKFGHLTSSTPWEPIDIDSIFFPASENENVDGDDDVFSKLLEVGGALTSPEKKMSVEEWIRWRAELGETKLKSECERMVMLFEKEGNRGLQALSGVRTL